MRGGRVVTGEFRLMSNNSIQAIGVVRQDTLLDQQS